MPVLEKVRHAYQKWHLCHNLLPKTQRYSIGNRIDKLFIESVEAIATAAFLPQEEKLPWVRLVLRKIDAIQVLLLLLSETKTLEDMHYIPLTAELVGIGKDLGGWNGKLSKNSTPTNAGAKK